jgi:glycosyltransferase involved in cell wall biosynthesis
MAHDVFIFPYRIEHAVFVPTSLLEAMSIGIPVIAADHVMYRDLTHDGDQPRCALHRTGDSGDLANVTAQLSRNYADAVVLAARTRGQIREQWTLPQCADELLIALNLRKSEHS